MKRKIYKHTNWKLGYLILTLTSLLMLGSVQAQMQEENAESAKDMPGLQLSFHETGKLRFRLEVSQPFILLHDNVAVYIMSQDRQILFANKYSHHELRMTTFDLSTLQDGTYSFEVRAGSNRVSQLFDIKTQLKRVVLDRN